MMFCTAINDFNHRSGLLYLMALAYFYSMKLEQEIQQETFKNEHLKAHINILYSASWFFHKIYHWLRPFDISWQQFNALRILRGKHPEPITLKELTKRMIDKMSNTSRLVEKMRKKNLVNRIIDDNDRRRVNVTITKEGLELLEEASLVMESEIYLAMRSISEEESIVLNGILDKMRG
jgi:DNA-binding MarR family transcriptional regulator